MSGQTLPGLNVSDEEKEKMRKQLAEAQKTSEGGENEKKLTDAIQRREEEQRKELMGTDLDFDPKEFITKGIIVRKGIPINDKVYVDMRSLSTKERMLAEALVRNRFGNMKMDTVYLTAIEAAMMAVAVTRINNQPFENPDVAKTADDPENKPLYEGKNKLFDMFLDSSSDLVTMLSVLYKNLEAVATPAGEVQKKS